MEDNSEKNILSTDLHDTPEHGSQQHLDDDIPRVSTSLQMPVENPQSHQTEAVSTLESAGSYGMPSETEFSNKITSKQRQGKRDDGSSASTSPKVEQLVSSEICEKSPEYLTVPMRQECLDNPQATFYYPSYSSSSDDDDEEGKAVRPFRLRKGRRTFSQCDSPEDSGLDLKIYDSEAKGKKTSKDNAKKLNKLLGTEKTSEVIGSPSKSTSHQKVSKSDSELLQMKCGQESSDFSQVTPATRCLSVPLLTDKRNKHKEKLVIKALNIFKFKTKSKSVSTCTKNIPDVTIDSRISSEKVDSHKSDNNSQILCEEVSNKTELSTEKSVLDSIDNSESPISINISDQISSDINAPLQSNQEKTICLLSKESNNTDTSEDTSLPSEGTSEKYLRRTGTPQMKLEGSQINPLDDVTGLDSPRNEGSELKSPLESPKTLNDTKSSSVKDVLVCETKLISDCAKASLSPQEGKLNLSGKSDVDLTAENAKTSCLTVTEKPESILELPLAVFKVPAIPRVPKSRSKSEKHSSPKTVENEASTYQSPKRPTDLNVGERSESYSFFPGRDQNNILRSYRSLPNVHSAPRKSENRRSVNLDIVRTAVRALFTGNPDPCTSNTNKSLNLRNIRSLGKSIESPRTEEISRNNPNKISDETHSESAVKTETKKPNICRKLNFDPPQIKTNVNRTLQECSSSELVDGMSGLYLYNVSHPSSDDDLSGRASTPERKPATIQAADPPELSIIDVSSDPETGEMDAGTIVADESPGTAKYSQCLFNLRKHAGGNNSPAKRKSAGLENALSSESPNKDAFSTEESGKESLSRPVKKGRLSSELDPDETKIKGESMIQVKDDRIDQKGQGSPSFLSPPSHSSRDCTSPSKRKVEELDTESETHSPGVSPGMSTDTAKRTKLKLPTPTVDHPDSDEK